MSLQQNPQDISKSAQRRPKRPPRTHSEVDFGIDIEIYCGNVVFQNQCSRIDGSRDSVIHKDRKSVTKSILNRFRRPVLSRGASDTLEGASETPPRALQEPPRSLQERPSGLQERPKGIQELRRASKRPPRGLQETPKHLQERARNPPKRLQRALPKGDPFWGTLFSIIDALVRLPALLFKPVLAREREARY